MNRLWVIGDSKKKVVGEQKVRFWQKVCKNSIKKELFATQAPFFESPITQKRSIFEESYISYGKRQKSCTLIVIYFKRLYLLPLIYNLLAKSNRTFYLTGRW